MSNEINKPIVEKKPAIKENATRKFLVIGCGDGGSNITSEIVKALPDDTYAVIYNTSERAMPFQTHNVRITPSEIDGSGKVRDYATEIFKNSTGRETMTHIMELINTHGHIDYVLVVGTADGGTGSGTVPTMAKMLKNNLDIPVIVMGVYPSIAEDAMSQYNAVQWQKDINAVGVPYIILDNNQEGDSVHDRVNAYAVQIVKLLSGNIFGDTDISIIDNRNLYMLLQQIGKRIVVAVSEDRPSTQATLDENLIKILERCYQPGPENATGIGVFVKGPSDVIARVNTDLQELQEKYGYALLKFAHIQEDEKPAIAVILSGCSEAAGRLVQMQGKYDDVMRSRNEGSSMTSKLAESMSNPIGEIKAAPKRSGLDFSALEE